MILRVVGSTLCSMLLVVLLVSSLYTNVPNSYQSFVKTTRLNSSLLAFADNGDDEKDGHDQDDAEELVEEYEDLVKRLGKTSDVSDEATVTDYLVDAISNFQEDTANLITDKDVKKHLLKILDNALKHAQKAGDKVLDLREEGSNHELRKSKKFIEQYIDKVEKFRGKKISTSDADLLISKANKILLDSMKNGTDIIDITVSIPLIVTDELINKAKSDGARLKQLVDALTLLGFTVILDATKNSPTQGSVSFFNVATSQLFDIIIPDSALAMFTTIGLSEEGSSADIILSTKEFAVLMNITPTIIDNVVNSENVIDSVIFVLIAICPVNFTVDECEVVFNDPVSVGGPFAIGTNALRIIGPAIGTITSSIISRCVRNLDDCMRVIEETIQHLGLEGLELTVEGIDRSFPTLHVIKNVVNDDGSTKIPSDFTIRVIFGDGPEEIVLFGASEPGSTIRLPPGNFVVREDPDPAYTMNIPYPLGCDDRIDVGQTRTCTIINDDVPPLPTTETICNDGIDNDGDGVIDSIDSDCAPPIVFFENFDGDVSRWPKTCPACTELRLRTAGPLGEEPPSLPFWGAIGVIVATPFGISNFQTGMSNQFSVPTEGDYRVSGVIGGALCDTCTIIGKVFVDGTLVFEQRGPTIAGDQLTWHPEFKEDTIHLTQGTHEIGLIMHTNVAYSGFFAGIFDNMKVEGPISTPMASSLASTGGRPYFDVQIDQKVLDVMGLETVIIPFQIDWQEGYETEPVSVSIIGLNGTGITHSISSITDSQFEVVFDISNDVQAGQHQFLVSVRDADDTVDTGITFNVE